MTISLTETLVHEVVAVEENGYFVRTACGRTLGALGTYSNRPREITCPVCKEGERTCRS